MKAIQKNNMSLTLKLKKVGHSLMLTIPKSIADLYGLYEGSEFEVVIDKEHLILKSKKL